MNIINKRKDYNYDTNYQSEDILKLNKLILEYFNKKNNMNTHNLYKLINYFYDIKIEETDYLDYVNSTDKLFSKIIEIPTEEVIQEMYSEGHGRDFSWWTENYQIIIKVLSNEFIPSKNEYTYDEIEKLIENGKIYPICRFCKKTSKPQNRFQNNIKYLLPYLAKELDPNDEYFNYMINKALSKIKLDNLINEIRIFITRLKLDSNIKNMTNHIYGEDEIGEINSNKKIADELINIYNKFSKEKIKTTELEIVMDYLRNLPKCEDWYQEIEIEQIINVFSFLDDEEDKELCKEIERLVISLNEVELAYEMAVNFDWVDKKIMGEIVIADGDPYFNYDFAMEVEGADIERHKQVILNSKYSDEVMLERAKALVIKK